MTWNFQILYVEAVSFVQITFSVCVLYEQNFHIRTIQKLCHFKYEYAVI